MTISPASPASPGTTATELNLLEYSRLVDLESERFVVLDDPRELTIVEAGLLDLFSVPLEGGTARGRWNFVGRVEKGGVIPGGPTGPRHGLIGRPGVGSRVSTVPAGLLKQYARTIEPPVAPEPYAGRHSGDGGPDRTPRDVGTCVLGRCDVIRGLDKVIVTLAKSMRRQLPPRQFTPISPRTQVSAAAGEAIRSVNGVLWVDVIEGTVEMADGMAGKIGKGDQVCLTERDWLVAAEDCVLVGRPTEDLLDADELWARLIVSTARTLYTMDRRVERRNNDERAAITARRSLDDQTMTRTAQRFETVIRDTDSRLRLGDVAVDSPALVAMRLVAGRLGFEAREPIAGSATTRDVDAIQAIANASGARARSIRLEGAWWKRDFGPVIGYRRATSEPVALLRVGPRYVMADGSRTRAVTPALAKELTNKASVVYPPFSPKIRTIGGLLRFGLSGNRPDLWRFAAMAIFVAGIGLLVPIMTGTVLGTFVAQARRDFVVEGSLLVIASAFAVAALSVVQNISILRIESRTTEKMQAGMWTRLLTLPASFFQRMSTGELATRVLGVNAAQEMLSGVVTTATVGLINALANLILVWFIDVRLALLATGLLVIAIVVAAVAGLIDLRQQKLVYECEQRIAARVFQLLTAVPKLRVAAAEDRAFSVWVKEFAEERDLAAKSRRTQNRLAVFNAGFPIACSIVIFALVGGPMRDTLSVTTFLSFFAAFSLLIASSLQFTGAAITATTIVPMFQHLGPIIAEAPEISVDKADPGDLSGRISLAKVSFRYEDGPLVLDNVSITVDEGDFVAIVGPSGSGKSTILRLLLGFEMPSNGTVLYDGQDLSELSVTAVRRQCGVVLQNGALMAGDIKTNIIGSTTYTVDDAWEAAEMAGIAADIKAMPMDMNTVLSEGANVLSGGQRQRLMIARSLIGRPRIVLFDEATSALDNPTQKLVAESVAKLNATRVVIAHRLSTIAEADRIIVLDRGKVVQEGTYEQLMQDENGTFAKLARRQMS